MRASLPSLPWAADHRVQYTPTTAMIRAIGKSLLKQPFRVKSKIKWGGRGREREGRRGTDGGEGRGEGEGGGGIERKKQLRRSMPVFTVRHCTTRVPLLLGDGYVVYYTFPSFLVWILFFILPADLQ